MFNIKKANEVLIILKFNAIQINVNHLYYNCENSLFSKNRD